MAVRRACLPVLMVLGVLAVGPAFCDEAGTLRSVLDVWKKSADALPEGCSAPDAGFPRLLSYEMGTVSKASVGGVECVICIVVCRFGKEGSDETVEYRGTFLLTPSRTSDTGFSLKVTWSKPPGSEPPVDEGQQPPSLKRLWPKVVEYAAEERQAVHVAVFGQPFHEVPVKPKDEFEKAEIARALEEKRKEVSGKLYAAEFRAPGERGMEQEKTYAKFGNKPMHARSLFCDIGEYDFDKKVLPVLLIDQALFTREKQRYRYANHYIGIVEVLLPVSEEDAKAIKRDGHRLDVFLLFRVTADVDGRRITQPEPLRRPTLQAGQICGTIPVVPEGLVVYDKDTKAELIRWSASETGPAKEPAAEAK